MVEWEKKIKSINESRNYKPNTDLSELDKMFDYENRQMSLLKKEEDL